MSRRANILPQAGTPLVHPGIVRQRVVTTVSKDDRRDRRLSDESTRHEANDHGIDHTVDVLVKGSKADLVFLMNRLGSSRMSLLIIVHRFQPLEERYAPSVGSV